MNENERQSTAIPALQPDADMLRQKASHYLVCFLDHCPLHDHCLRWLAGCHADTAPVSHVAVNPHHPQAGSTSCVAYRPAVQTVMKRGMTSFYHDMPSYMERDIRNHLIQLFTRTRYFKMRRGDLPVTPAEQQQIAAVCHEHGWTGPLRYDSEQKEWMW